jgi:hypothetical protein
MLTYYMIVFVKAENWSLLWAGPLTREGERIQAAGDRPQVRGKREVKEYVHLLVGTVTRHLVEQPLLFFLYCVEVPIRYNVYFFSCLCDFESRIQDSRTIMSRGFIPFVLLVHILSGF